MCMLACGANGNREGCQQRKEEIIKLLKQFTLHTLLLSYITQPGEVCVTRWNWLDYTGCCQVRIFSGSISGLIGRCVEPLLLKADKDFSSISILRHQTSCCCRIINQLIFHPDHQIQQNSDVIISRLTVPVLFTLWASIYYKKATEPRLINPLE